MTAPITIAGVCSGIGGFDLGFERAGFQVLWTCERDAQARTVLQARFPDSLHLTDMLHDDLLAQAHPHVLAGGTPCQGFSVAGLRRGLSDDRSNLALRFCQLAAHFSRSLVVWENVPGVLSMADNAFGCFLAALVGADAPLVSADKRGRWPCAGVVSGPQRTAAWRVLDAQYFGVAQRRRRVFVVADPGDGRAPEILFESDGLRRDTPPRRETGERPAPTLSARTQGGGGLGTDTDTDLDGGLIAHCLSARPHLKHDDTRDTLGPVVAPTLDASHNRKFGSDQWVRNGFAVVTPPTFSIQAGALKQNPAHGPDGVGVKSDGVAYTLEARAEVQCVAIGSFQQNSMVGKGSLGFDPDTQVLRPVNPQADHQMIVQSTPAVAFNGYQRSISNVASPLTAGDAKKVEVGVLQDYQVRRLTPRECDRLQGFPDDWGLVPDHKGKPMSDSARYKQLGNAVNVAVSTWLAQRIAHSLQLTPQPTHP
jgi:DNA (cytosine-5)-methyltransferase 1